MPVKEPCAQPTLLPVVLQTLTVGAGTLTYMVSGGHAEAMAAGGPMVAKFMTAAQHGAKRCYGLQMRAMLAATLRPFKVAANSRVACESRGGR